MSSCLCRPISLRLCLCMFMCVFVCVHGCVYESVYERSCVCVHVCVFMCVFTCALMCMRYNVIVRILFLSVHVCARAWVHAALPRQLLRNNVFLYAAHSCLLI